MLKSIVRTALGAALLLAWAIPAFAADTSPAATTVEPKDSQVVAKVNGKDITFGEVKEELAAVPQQVRQQVPFEKLYPTLLDQAVKERIVSAAGYAKKLEDKEDVKRALKELERRLVAQEYLADYVSAKITDKMLEAKYNELKANTKPQDEIKASHILVKTEDEANDIIKQLKGGADFATLAKDKSIDPGSAKNGGDLGYFTQNEMVKEFSDAAFAMKPGEVSSTPVKSSYGYHIIKVVDRRPATPPTFEQVKPQLKAEVGQEIATKEIDHLVDEAKVEKFGLDGKPLPKESSLDAPAKAAAGK